MGIQQARLSLALNIALAVCMSVALTAICISTNKHLAELREEVRQAHCETELARFFAQVGEKEVFVSANSKKDQLAIIARGSKKWTVLRACKASESDALGL